MITLSPIKNDDDPNNNVSGASILVADANIALTSKIVQMDENTGFTVLATITGPVTTKTMNFSNVVNGVQIEVSINLPIFDMTTPDLTISKNGYVDNENEIKSRVISGKRDITDEFVITTTPAKITASLNGISRLTRNISSGYSKLISSDDESLSILKACFVDNFNGKLILKKPVYQSFSELRSSLGKTLAGELIAERKDTDINTFIATSKKYIQLGSALDNDELNDRNYHDVVIKVLPIQSVLLDAANMNSPAYRLQVTGNDVDDFGYDRIWINTNTFQAQPITLKGKTYRSEATSSYSSDDLTNKDGMQVYLANEDGDLIKYILSGTTLTEVKLGDDSGNCTSDVSGSIDNRVVSKKPLYDSTYDWFKSEFYTDGTNNPFWQYISITETINPSTMEVESKISFKKITKTVSSSSLEDCTDDESYGAVIPATLYSIADKTNALTITPNYNFIDYANGTLNFILYANNDQYKNNPTFIKYGIKYNNPFEYKNGKLKLVWQSYDEIENYSDYSYTINSTENIFNKKDIDASKVSITELGIFDQNHKLICYSYFPPIEYRSVENCFHVTAFISDIPLRAKA
jgi:hypothetical protein